SCACALSTAPIRPTPRIRASKSVLKVVFIVYISLSGKRSLKASLPLFPRSGKRDPLAGGVGSVGVGAGDRQQRCLPFDQRCREEEPQRRGDRRPLCHVS